MSVRPNKMPSQAGWNGFTGRIWPSGRRLETPGVELAQPNCDHLFCHKG